MSLVFLFDLDNTLIPPIHNNITHASQYKYNIKSNIHLYNLLHQNPFPKFIFSNASYSHVIYSLDALSVFNKSFIKRFQDIYTYTELGIYKPDPMAYHMVQEKIASKLKTRDFKILFFDDLSVNLITAKKFNWTTILIGNKYDYNSSVDYYFNTIEDALMYFNQRLLNNF